MAPCVGDERQQQDHLEQHLQEGIEGSGGYCAAVAYRSGAGVEAGWDGGFGCDDAYGTEHQ